jgi:hypothetical protein
MFAILSFLEGYKTYIAVLGLLGLAVFQVSTGDLVHAVQSFLAALAAAGLHADLSSKSPS